MKHHALPQFWDCYNQLPLQVQKLADKNFQLLKSNQTHPSLRLKKVGEALWSARVGSNFRTLARERTTGLHWFWIGAHTDYGKLLRS